ncbi:hypothetical protein [Sphingomonas sp.]|uniref:hypothetical protein n=1 Tax=Sphingomonas sp. TaxID=28214 RepID=UPI001E0EE6AE|nr:hypothetical protein [Sphingomonas sp.]MBX9796447.1 hypothetical protein [Sphingomonas sp.]
MRGYDVVFHGWRIVRIVVIAVVALGLIGGGMALLASRNSEKPLKRVEKVVPLADLQK